MTSLLNCLWPFPAPPARDELVLGSAVGWKRLFAATCSMDTRLLFTSALTGWAVALATAADEVAAAVVVAVVVVVAAEAAAAALVVLPRREFPFLLPPRVFFGAGFLPQSLFLGLEILPLSVLTGLPCCSRFLFLRGLYL